MKAARAGTSNSCLRDINGHSQRLCKRIASSTALGREVATSAGRRCARVPAVDANQREMRILEATIVSRSAGTVRVVRVMLSRHIQ